MNRWVTFIVITLVVGLAGNAIGKTIHVKVGGTGDGSSWSNAYGNLQTALDDAEPNDSIWVAEGTYKPSKLYDPCDVRTATFQMKNGVGIYGGFSAVGDPNWEHRDWEKYETVLSGDLLGNDVEVGDPCDLRNDPCRIDNCYHVFYHPNDTNLDTSAVLDGFTITAGYGGPGGGMFNYRCSPTIYNCLFVNNFGRPFGGAIYNYFSSACITSCSFVNNMVSPFGGGIANGGGMPKITYCTFTNNKSGWKGGGIFNNGSDANITFCTFQSNFADEGGGIYNQNSNPTINNCIFNSNQYAGVRNYAESSPTVTHCEFTDNVGGGMNNLDRSSPTVTHCKFGGNTTPGGGGGMMNYYKCNVFVADCVFRGNKAEGNGGGMYNYFDSSTVVLRCIFNGNTAGAKGGGMYITVSCPLVANCIFSGNSAVEGGGVAHKGSYTVTRINNCTFGGNSADANGGAIWNDENYRFFNVKNCILWGNTAQDGTQIHNTPGNSATVTYSDIQGGYPGTGNIDTDPLFIDPNGPDNIPGTEDDNLHLLPYSPCIDAGDPTGDYTNQTDIDGEQRVLYDNVDIGADEVFPIAGDIDQDGDVDFRDYAYFTMHWLKGK